MKYAMKYAISFDVGGVLDSKDTPMFLDITSELVRAGHRIIIVTAIGHGLPERWGFTEQARYATSYARLLGKGYIQSKHFHELFVTPDVEGHPATTGRYKDFVLAEQYARLHVDDNHAVAKGITSCKVLMWDDEMKGQEDRDEQLYSMVRYLDHPRFQP